MADQEWLKNLASAAFVDGQWTHADPDGVRQLTERRLGDAIDLIEDEAAVAAAIYNGHAGSERHIRVLPLPVRSGAAGFLLLAGRVQVSLHYRPHQLSASLSVLRGYASERRELWRLTPRVDPFGSVVWGDGNGLLMTPELIIKRLFEELNRIADAAGAGPG